MNKSALIVTNHAKARWSERFPKLDIEITYLQTRSVGRGTRKKVKKSCPEHIDLCNIKFKSRYLLMTRQGIVFVMQPPETVVTVLDFRQDSYK